MKPKRLKVRGFIEGVEVPVISTVVNTQSNAPATASLQIVPSDAALEFHPRSLVHIFFCDFVDGPGDNIYVGGTGVETRSLGLSQEEIDKQKYRLLFVGETVGFAYMKARGGRQLVLQCVDLSNYWDSCFYFKRGWGYKAQFAGAAFKTLNEWLSSTGEVIAKKLMTPPVGHKNVTGLVGGIIHLLQAIGGVYRNDVKIKGTSVFFSIAELRLRLSSIIAAPVDDTPKKLLKRSGFLDVTIKKNIKGLGREFNFRRAILALMRYIFYEVYPNPCSMIIPPDASLLEDPEATRLSDHPKWKFVIYLIRGMIASVEGFINTLENAGDLSEQARKDYITQMVSGLENMEIKLGALAKKFGAEAPTKTVTKKKWVTMEKATPMWGMDPSLQTVEREVEYQATVKAGGLMKIRKKVLIAQTKIREARDACRTVARRKKKLPDMGGTLTYKEVVTKPSKGRYLKTLPSWGTKPSKKIHKALDKADGHLRELLGLTVKGKRAVSTVELSRLANQVFRPDPWFTAPPRCNVIFPDQYFQVSYNRNHINEVTRLLLRTSDTLGGSDMMWDNFYYAPSAQGVLKQDEVAFKRAKEVGLGYMVANRDLMNHELYTGIVPRFEKARGLKIFGVRSGKVVAGDKKTKVSYAQRLTNFLFFKYRYAGRITNISCAFNPYLAPGFPALLIDRQLDTIKAREITTALEKNEGDLSKIRGMAGTQFLGVIAGMSHSLSQSSGTTSVQLSYSRTHREQVDPIGADKIVAKASNKSGEKTRKKYKICALPDYPPQKGKDHGLYGGTIESATVVPGDTGTYPLWNSPTGRKRASVLTQVRGNTKKKAKDHGLEVVSLTQNPTVNVTFSVYSVTEIKEKTERRIIDMPFEDIVRPAWYGNVWTNRIIGGAVYQPIFGTGAITDPIVVKDREKTITPGASSDALKEAAEYDATDPFGEKAFSIVISDLDDSATIENAIDFLVYVYSQIKQGGYDIDSFIRSYTWRPIASMYDMFGSSDLEYDETGAVLSGQEGFHSKAFGQFKDLFAFTNEDVREILGVSRHKKGTYYVGDNEVYKTEVPVSSRLDVRKERQDRVLAYISEIEKKGILG